MNKKNLMKNLKIDLLLNSGSFLIGRIKLQKSFKSNFKKRTSFFESKRMVLKQN